MGEYREGVGPLKLYIDDQQVAESRSARCSATSRSAARGCASATTAVDAVSSEYAGSQFEFTGGKIVKVVFDIADDAYVDVEAHLAAAYARD